MPDTTGALWFVLSLAIFVPVQRWLHRTLQRLLIVATGSRRAAILLYSLLFLPFVLLHEASHRLMAALVRVPPPDVLDPSGGDAGRDPASRLR
ncbi:MAG: hypothetical protein A2Y93_13835 [Chloroflexi bacterium RBG_13_68_17]|nr:MAG: hypothetical protein A2Y93_13835 [Chloroflexi bacterium RBG_13_68_17]